MRGITMNAKILEINSLLHVKNVMYATDLSLCAERALPFAHEIARRYGATLHIVHAIQPDISPFVPPLEWPRMVEEGRVFRQESMAELDLRLSDVHRELIFRPGNIVKVLSEELEKTSCDLLVISTHGRTGLQKALVGSVAEKMFRHTKCPVLTVGPKVTVEPRGTGELNRILYATDFSAESLAAAPFAISLAREHRAHLILLNCIENEGTSVEAMRQILADLVPYGVDLLDEPECIVARAKATDKILEIAEEHRADLIVLGIHGAKDQQGEITLRRRPGVLKVITEAKCPVLTVRG